jgi:hypothetical protein
LGSRFEPSTFRTGSDIHSNAVVPSSVVIRAIKSRRMGWTGRHGKYIEKVKRTMNQDSLLCLVTGVRAGRWRDRGSIFGRTEFTLSRKVQTDFEAHPLSSAQGATGSSTAGKADSLPPLIPKNIWSCTCSHIRFHLGLSSGTSSNLGPDVGHLH